MTPATLRLVRASAHDEDGPDALEALDPLEAADVPPRAKIGEHQARPPLLFRKGTPTAPETRRCWDEAAQGGSGAWCVPSPAALAMRAIAADPRACPTCGRVRPEPPRAA